MKNEEQQNIFLPAEVDEQIDAYLATTPTSGHTSDDISAQTSVRDVQASVRDVQAYFAPPRQDEALNRVWQRFAEQRAKTSTLQAGQQATKVLTLSTKAHSTRQRDSGPFRRQLSILAAVIVVALLIGSTLLLFQQARHNSEQAGPVPRQTTMFALVNHTLYRLDTKNHRTLWQFHTPKGQPEIALFPGQALDGTYYVWGFGQQPMLYAVDITNGKLRWQRDIADMGSVIVSGNTLYISAEKDDYLEVIALNVKSGAQKWEQRLIQIHRPNTVFSSPPSVQLLAASDTAVYGVINTQQNDGHHPRFALNAKNGQFIWQQDEVVDKIFEKNSLTGFLVDGILCVVQAMPSHQIKYIDQSYGLLQGYDVQSGKQLWSKPLDNIPSKATLLNGTIYLDTNFDDTTVQKKGSIYAFSARDGSLRWQYHKKAASSYPTVTDKGIYTNVYENNKGGQMLIAFDPATGKQRWIYAFHDPVTVEYPPAADDNQVYLSLPGNTIQILQASDGKPLGSFKVDPQHVDPNNRIRLQVVEL